MTSVKKQHFVPQFYLRGFTNEKSKLHVYDKFQQKAFLSNVGDVASSNYFYDFPEEVIEKLKQSIQVDRDKNLIDDTSASMMLDLIDKQFLEDHLSKLEARFSRIMREILEKLNKRGRFNRKYRLELSMMIAIQYWRTNEQLQDMKELSQKIDHDLTNMLNKMNEADGTSFTTQDLGVAYNEEEISIRHKKMLLDIEFMTDLANEINKHIWIIGVNNTNEPLYTSDHPIARSAHKTDDWRSNMGIASPGIEINFPISPKYCLMLYERNFFKHIEHKDNGLTYLQKDNVIYYNSMQVKSSHRQVYSHNKNFDLVEEMLEKDPTLKARRPRWK